MKYYSDITKQLYETREQLFKAEQDYKMELITKARADEKAKKIADLEAQLAELRRETTMKTDNVKSSDKPIASEKSNEDNTAPTKVYDAGREDRIDYSKTIEAIKKMVDNFKFKYPSFEFQDIEDDKNELISDGIKSSAHPGEKIPASLLKRPLPQRQMARAEIAASALRLIQKTRNMKSWQILDIIPPHILI